MISFIRSSKLSRPMNCAGSLFMDLEEPPAGEAAKEGTAAGEWLEMLLTRPDHTEFPTHAKNGVLFNEDMKFYGEIVKNNILSRANGPILCEQKIDWQTRSGIWIKGQYDASYVCHEGFLNIDDLKYGWGIVEPKENWQLLAYAIGEVLRRGIAFPYIVLRIHQPRPHHEDGIHREWKISYEELLSYKEKIEERMTLIANGYKELQSGSHCKYCPAQGDACPAFQKAFYNALDYSQDFIQDSLSDEELGKHLDLADRALEIIKQKKESLEQLAGNRIKSGSIIPGFALDEKYGHRSWKPSINPEVIKLMTGKSVIKNEMLSPAQAEKIGIPKELLNQVCERKFLGIGVKRTDMSKLGEKIFGKRK